MILKFAPFTKKNYDDYLRLYSPYFIEPGQIHKKRYRTQLSKTGFMVGKPYELSEMNDAKIHICAQKKKKVIGIIRGDNIVIEELEPHETLTWKCKTAITKAYYSKRGIELGNIIVSIHDAGRGVGTLLLEEYIKKCKRTGIKHIFSWVVSSPKNIPSMNFHKKHGFEHVATFKALEAWDIPNYKSYLFYLPIR